MRVAVNAGRTTELGDIPGPCAGCLAEYGITGTVFVDTDADGLPGAAEVGLANVVVELSAPGSTVPRSSPTGRRCAAASSRTAGT